MPTFKLATSVSEENKQTTYLANAGFDTLVIEKNSFSGGYCSVFKRGKFSFHAGPEDIMKLGKEEL